MHGNQSLSVPYQYVVPPESSMQLFMPLVYGTAYVTSYDNESIHILISPTPCGAR